MKAKLKLKFDKKAVLDFLLQNVEKMVLAVIALIFLSMLYSSLTRAGRFDKTPDQLKADVTKGRNEIERATTDPKLEAKDYEAQAKRSRVRIEEKPYENLVSLDPPLFPTRGRRGPPPLFTVQDLRGAAGVGGVKSAAGGAAGGLAGAAAAAPGDRRGIRLGPGRPLEAAANVRAGGEDVRGKRWIVLTGLIPREKQELAYAETFRQAAGYDALTDSPSYVDCKVERVELSATDDPANPDWKKAKEFILSSKIKEIMQELSVSADADIVAPEYIEKRLVFPLPPLTNRAWDASAAHEPEIPAGRPNDREGGIMRNAVPAGRDEIRRATPDGRPGGRSAGPLGGDGREREGEAEDNAFGDTPTNTNKRTPERVEVRVEEKKTSPYRLFRFIDFGVEPGKQYVYRVLLALRNPNEGKKPELLKSPDLAKESYLKTKWSDPSPAVAVPRDIRVLAGAVRPARNPAETSAELLMIKWVQSKGVEVFKEFKTPASPPIMRGQFLNFAEVVGKPVSGGGAQPAVGRGGVFGGGGLGGGPGVFPVAGGSTVKTDFNSNATVVDLRGGGRLSGGRGTTLTAGGQMLILDADGNLAVHDELDDTPVYEQITSSPEPAREAAPSPRRLMERPGAGGLPGRGLLEGLQDDRTPKRRPAR
jgi:hypothetical protein